MVPMNVGYSLLNPYVNYNLKKEYSDEERKNMMYTSFLHRTKIDPVDIGVNIENSLFAYIFLLDSKVRISLFFSYLL